MNYLQQPVPLTKLDLATFKKERRPDSELSARLDSLAAEYHQLLGDILQGLRPSANNLREILRLSEEIAARDKLNLHSVFTLAGLDSILSNEKLSRADKTKKLKNELADLRYPERARMAARLRELQKELVKATGVRVKFPEDLEGDSLLIELRAKDTQQMRGHGESLSKTSEHPALREIFDILRGEY